MQAYKIEKRMKENGQLVLSGLPFMADDLVEIIILHKQGTKKKEPYPLKGKIIKYESPFEPVVLEASVYNEI
ncbi:MAG: hypothetical protein AB7S75_24065 [Desulfococcaceae bacterium]